MEVPVRIAMWSGPRNISTALMRSWGARADTVVCDEPLYASYLLATGREHPGREEILRECETDWRVVARRLTGPNPAGKSIFYQKHMAHHLLPEMETEWVAQLRNCLLIREPERMLASLTKVLPFITIDETGLPQQVAMFRLLRVQSGGTMPVVDSRDVLEHPRRTLSRLCDRLGVPFDEAMLTWKPGPRETDGAWAKHWYTSVCESSGFAPYDERSVDLAPELLGVASEARDLYAELYESRIDPRHDGVNGD